MKEVQKSSIHATFPQDIADFLCASVNTCLKPFAMLKKNTLKKMKPKSKKDIFKIKNSGLQDKNFVKPDELLERHTTW